MAEYQKIEYRIGKDGKVVETVLNATGESCLSTTTGIEQALGEIESQEKLPEFADDALLEATEWLRQQNQYDGYGGYDG